MEHSEESFIAALRHDHTVQPRLVIETPMNCRSDEKWSLMVTAAASDDRLITIKVDGITIGTFDCETGLPVEINNIPWITEVKAKDVTEGQEVFVTDWQGGRWEKVGSVFCNDKMEIDLLDRFSENLIFDEPLDPEALVHVRG